MKRRSSRNAPRKLLSAAAFSVATLGAAMASATDYEVSGNTAFQAYEVANPWGDGVIDRRRLMQTLGLSAYDLQGKHVTGQAEYNVQLRLRLNADFGTNANVTGAFAGGETDPTVAHGARFVPGLQEAPLDLMYGYVEGRNLAHGWLGFKLGRQYMTDMLGWWSFDGGLVRITTPFYVQAEVYGGLEQRGGLPLSSSRFEQQGIWRGSHSGFGGSGQPSAADFPSYQYAEPAPAFGVALETSGPSFAHGRFDYRRVYNTGSTITTQFPDALGGYHVINNTRESQEKLGYSADISKPDLGGIKGGFSYDLYNQIVATYYGGLEGYVGSKVMLGADIDYYVPTFDADSIWNWFTHSPITSLTGRANFDVTKRFAVSASGGARIWTTDGNPTTFGTAQAAGCSTLYNCPQVTIDPKTGKASPVTDANGDPVPFARADANRALTSTTDFLGNLAGRYRFRSGDLGLRGMLETGSRGKREGADVNGEKRLDGGRYALGARVSLYSWNDVLRPDRDATSFGYVLAAGWHPARFADMRVEWEHDMNRLVGQRFRVLALVNLLVMK